MPSVRLAIRKISFVHNSPPSQGRSGWVFSCLALFNGGVSEVWSWHVLNIPESHHGAYLFQSIYGYPPPPLHKKTKEEILSSKNQGTSNACCRSVGKFVEGSKEKVGITMKKGTPLKTHGELGYVVSRGQDVQRENTKRKGARKM